MCGVGLQLKQEKYTDIDSGFKVHRAWRFGLVSRACKSGRRPRRV